MRATEAGLQEQGGLEWATTSPCGNRRLLTWLLIPVFMVLAASCSSPEAGNHTAQLLAETGDAMVDGKSLGPATAPVHVVVYSSLDCGYCQTMEREIEPALIRRYVSTGRVRLEVRTLASRSGGIWNATQAALCAADQGRFWEYRDSVLKSWSRDNPPTYSRDDLTRIADELRLDRAIFDECLDGGTKGAEIDEIVHTAAAEGVRGVPTTFVNGRKIEGLRSLESYLQAIGGELAKGAP